jgi:hypothetical protein
MLLWALITLLLREEAMVRSEVRETMSRERDSISFFRDRSMGDSILALDLAKDS